MADSEARSPNDVYIIVPQYTEVRKAQERGGRLTAHLPIWECYVIAQGPKEQVPGALAHNNVLTDRVQASIHLSVTRVPDCSISCLENARIRCRTPQGGVAIA